METYKGLVLAERNAGTGGKFIDILTEHNTLQEVFVRGSKKSTSSAASLTQCFSYAAFSVRRNGKSASLDSVKPIRIFYKLRESLTRLSLATYFSELIRYSVREFRPMGETCEILRLMLNTLHYLETGEREEGFLKPVFELRLMTELGMMPDLLMCRVCGAFLPEKLWFSVEEGCFYCTSCGKPFHDTSTVLLLAPALQAMRHIIFADLKRMFRFRLGEDNLRTVRFCTERFVEYHLGFAPEALHFYHQVSAPLLQWEETTYEQTSSDSGIS